MYLLIQVHKCICSFKKNICLTLLPIFKICILYFGYWVLYLLWLVTFFQIHSYSRLSPGIRLSPILLVMKKLFNFLCSWHVIHSSVLKHMSFSLSLFHVLQLGRYSFWFNFILYVVRCSMFSFILLHVSVLTSPAPLISKTVLFSVYVLTVLSKSIWRFNSRVCILFHWLMDLFVPAPCCFKYCSFVIYFEFW